MNAPAHSPDPVSLASCCPARYVTGAAADTIAHPLPNHLQRDVLAVDPATGHQPAVSALANDVAFPGFVASKRFELLASRHSALPASSGLIKAKLICLRSIDTLHSHFDFTELNGVAIDNLGDTDELAHAGVQESNAPARSRMAINGYVSRMVVVSVPSGPLPQRAPAPVTPPVDAAGAFGNSIQLS